MRFGSDSRLHNHHIPSNQLPASSWNTAIVKRFTSTKRRECQVSLSHNFPQEEAYNDKLQPHERLSCPLCLRREIIDSSSGQEMSINGMLAPLSMGEARNLVNSKSRASSEETK